MTEQKRSYALLILFDFLLFLLVTTNAILLAIAFWVAYLDNLRNAHHLGNGTVLKAKEPFV
jgi:hypothetical protein